MKVFISSTVRDLVEERSAVRKVISHFGFTPFCSEYEGARWIDSARTIFQEIDNCHIFIGIYGQRYGYVPPRGPYGEIYDGKTSVTEAEFKQAKSLNKPMLLYIKQTSKRGARQKSFLSQVTDFYEGSFISHFNTSNQLRQKVREDVVHLLTSLVNGEYRYPKHQLPKLAIFANQDKLHEYVAQEMIIVLKSRVVPTIGLFAGRTAGAVYDKFIQLYPSQEIRNIAKVRFYMDAEHFGLADTHPSTYQNFLKTYLLRHIQSMVKIPMYNKLVAIPSSIKSGNLDAVYRDYDSRIGGSRIHLQLLGIGPNGQVASIDPSDRPIVELEEGYTSMVELSDFSYNYLFPKPVTKFDITIGFGNILQCADRIILVAAGKNKAEIIKKTLLEPISSRNPASLLKKHHDLTIACDCEAVEELPEPWLKRYPNIIAGNLK